MKRAVALCAVLTLSCTSTDRKDNTSVVSASVTNSASPPATSSVSTQGRVETLLRAELTRRVDEIKGGDQTSRDVLVRRAAARALARIRGVKARPGLLHALADEDETVVAWGAYGIGDSCAGFRDAAVRALLATLPVWPPKSDAVAEPDRLNANRALIRAIGRCASTVSEAALVELLRRPGPSRHDAVAALGDVATKKQKLREETFVALLKLASGDASSEPDAYALYPFGRIAHLPPSLIEQARDVATRALKKAGADRIFAIRALGRTDPLAVSALRSVIADAKSFNAAERAEAIRAVVRFGDVGQRALQKELPKLVPKDDAISLTTIVSADFGVVLTLLSSLGDVGSAKALLRRLTERTAPPGAPASILRRLSWLRCDAARLVAERDYDAKLLRDCDLTKSGSIGARAMVATLGVDGVKLKGRRLKTWLEFATGERIRARQDAITQIGSHPEIRNASKILAGALNSKVPGVIAAAAEVINKHPQRVRRRGKGRRRAAGAVDERVRKALLAQLADRGGERDIEALSAVVKATGVLGLSQAKPDLEAMCGSPYEALRQSAKKSLITLSGGRGKVSCSPPPAGLPVPVELTHLRTRLLRLELQTDVGALSLELDPTYAPLAVTRVADLVKRGYYNGMVVHRVVAGFVSQFGSPTADGYGGAPGALPLSCETSPLHYAKWRVGVALAGRDTGSSQLFVTHAAYPHLDGRYAQIGLASGPWDALVDGDRIVQVKTKE